MADKHGDTQHGYSAEKVRYLNRLKRIEGQARGITRMVEEDAYCIDILTQVSALTRALQAVAVGLTNDHIKHCVVNAARSGDDEAAEAKLQEVTNAITRLIKS
ncbi:metal-sensitive transcriptional regulator [Nocardioides sp. Bht2]|uniref:metal-sensitive transcriptional regulator n=1 Tax=Nocardioides sp. Bht2 TaxID=3392297 RepID=UPI0039B46E9F